MEPRSSSPTVSSPSLLWDAGDLVTLERCNLCGSRDLKVFLPRWDGLRLVECGGCRVVFVNPQPSWRQIIQRYGEEYFTGQRDFYRYKRYLDVSRWMIAARAGPGVAQFRRSVDPRGQRLLEIGCGYGAFLVIAREMGAIVQGIELSSHAAEVGRREFGLEIVTGRVEELGLGDASFDIVTFFDVLEHVTNPTAFMTAVRRLLRPGGTLFFLVPNLARYDLEGPRWAGLRYHPEHVYYYRLETLRPWLESLGFRVRRYWTEGVGHEAPSTPYPAVPRGDHPWRHALKRMPGLRPLARVARTLWHTASLEAWRARRGYGHDLIVLAE